MDMGIRQFELSNYVGRIRCDQAEAENQDNRTVLDSLVRFFVSDSEKRVRCDKGKRALTRPCRLTPSLTGATESLTQ